MKDTNKSELKEMLIYMLEVDIDNCELKPIDFIEHIVEALTNKEQYIKELMDEYKTYSLYRD